jgi:hypothetical protein
MAINKNHEFEELDGIKCAIVEKNCTSERVGFLKELLEWNRYSVVVVESPAPKAAPVIQEPLPPTTYTVGVTDLTFNPINAIFGRILKTKDNRIVTQAYWKQQVNFSDDEVPYFEMKKV